MGDEADAMWDRDMVQEGYEWAEAQHPKARSMLNRSCKTHTFRKLPKPRRPSRAALSSEQEK